MNKLKHLIITGHAAIDHAARQGLTLNKYADPIEEARAGLTVEEAEEVAKEDASLIWIKVTDPITDVLGLT